MKRFKKFIINRIFNKRQQAIIANAIWFSEHTYRRRNQIDGAAEVKQVSNEIGYLFENKHTYTQEEVDVIVKNTLNEVGDKVQQEVNNHVEKAFRKGITKGVEKAFKTITDILSKHENTEPLAVGSVIDTKKCEECNHNDDCIVFNVIKEFEAEEKEEQKQPSQPENEKSGKTEEEKTDNGSEDQESGNFDTADTASDAAKLSKEKETE